MRPQDLATKAEGNFFKATDVMEKLHQVLVYTGQWRQKVREKDTKYLGFAKDLKDHQFHPGQRFNVRAVHPNYYHLETDCIVDAAGDLYIFNAPEKLRKEDQ